MGRVIFLCRPTYNPRPPPVPSPTLSELAHKLNRMFFYNNITLHTGTGHDLIQTSNLLQMINNSINGCTLLITKWLPIACKLSANRIAEE